MSKTMYNSLKETLVEIQDLRGAVAVMSWDQEVMMPKGGAEFRARQIATLSGLIHQKSTSDEIGELLENLAASNSDLSWEQKRNIELALDDFQKQKKIPKRFIERFSRLKSEAFQTWAKAREEDDFSVFTGSLESLIEMSREKTELLGFEHHPYDALLDIYDPGTQTTKVESTFAQVRRELVPFYQEVLQQESPDNSFMFRNFPEDKQWEFSLYVLENMGYDFNYGRQDKAPHPFSINFSPQDVRVTTRIDAHNFLDMTWSTIHEGGHALYELGIPPENYGLPTGSACSLSIHESQSRLWENNVGRSLDYWKAHYSKLQTLFPESLNDINLDQFYAGTNKVQPSLIRVDADELSYHLHILVRFELEKALIEGSLDVKDAMEAWNTKYKAYLNIDVPDARQGILQDIHWSHGSFGYFPTYSLGSFYAAQFFEKASNDIPKLSEEISKGDNAGLLKWLRENIHQQGRLYDSEDLCEQVTGEKLNLSYFMNYARKKFGTIYGI